MKERWVVHIIAKNELIYQRDELTALREANEINKDLIRLSKAGWLPTAIAIVRDDNTED